MKKIFVCVLAMAMAFASCNNDDNEIPVGKKFEASLNLSGLEVVDMGPMNGGGLKISNVPYGHRSNDLYAIQVKEGEGGKVIAGGMFTGEQLFGYGTEGEQGYIAPLDLKVTLEHGKEYSVEATLVIGGENVYNEELQTGLIYGAPFLVKEAESTAGGAAPVVEANCSIVKDAEEWTTEATICEFRDLTAQVTGGKYKNDILRTGDRWYVSSGFMGNYHDNYVYIRLERMSIKVEYRFDDTTIPAGYSVCTGLRRGLGMYDEDQYVEYERVVNEEEVIYTINDISGYLRKDDPEVTWDNNINIFVGMFQEEGESVKKFRYGITIEPNHFYRVQYNTNTTTKKGLNVYMSEDWGSQPNQILLEGDGREVSMPV